MHYPRNVLEIWVLVNYLVHISASTCCSSPFDLGQVCAYISVKIQFLVCKGSVLWRNITQCHNFSLLIHLEVSDKLVELVDLN